MEKHFNNSAKASKSFPKKLNVVIGPHLAFALGIDDGVRALDLAGITRLGDLVALSEDDLYRVSGLKRRYVPIITNWVASRGFKLGCPDQNWLAYTRRRRLRSKIRERRWIENSLRVAPTPPASSFRSLG
jgi:hypothetical protein